MFQLTVTHEHIFLNIQDGLEGWLGAGGRFCLSEDRNRAHLSETYLCDGNISSCTNAVTSTPKLAQESTDLVWLLHLLHLLSTNEIQLRCQYPHIQASA